MNPPFSSPCPCSYQGGKQGSPYPPYPRTRSHSLCLQSLARFPATEPGRERASAASSVGAGPAMPAQDAEKGGRVPSPLNLHDRAGIIKGEHLCPTRASAWVCCAPGGVAKISRCQADPARGGGWLHPVSVSALRPPPRPRARVCRCRGHCRPESPGRRGPSATPLRNSPLFWSAS